MCHFLEISYLTLVSPAFLFLIPSVAQRSELCRDQDVSDYARQVLSSWRNPEPACASAECRQRRHFVSTKKTSPMFLSGFFKKTKTNAESCFGLNGHSSLRKLYLIGHSDLSDSRGRPKTNFKKQYFESIAMEFAQCIKLPLLNVCTLFHGRSWCSLPFFFFIILKRFGRQRKPIQMRLRMWRSITHSAHILLLFHRRSSRRSTWDHESSVSQWLF